MKRVYAENNSVKKEQQRAAKVGIENLPAAAARGAIMGRRRTRKAGGAGGRR